MALNRSLWLCLALGLAAAAAVLALAARQGQAPADSSRHLPPAPTLTGVQLMSAHVPGAAATLASRAPAFRTQARRALAKADKALARDSRRAQAALAEWASDDSAGTDSAIAAIGPLRSDIGALRRALAKLKPRAKKDKKARQYLLSSLAQTDKGLRGVTSMLVLDDPTATELLSPAQKAFNKADSLAGKASTALGCKGPCSRAL